jgi:hypothetical protein
MDGYGAGALLTQTLKRAEIKESETTINLGSKLTCFECNGDNFFFIMVYA